MRILRIRFNNLNSLAGEWDIDLTHPAFIADGIFAITGPTGAGKTTILDALCLALYGRTPRLSRISKSGNELMSRQTGECFAEVTFETQAGRFRCHWSQRRARKKSNGELQPPKHEISSVDSGEIFESKMRGVAEQIETVTGMDFDRFTRSMLLAQGGFAAFLQAAPDDRAPILEQITGTAIYSRISVRVHERLRDERDKRSSLQAETDGIVILPVEQENQIIQSVATQQKEEPDHVNTIIAINQAITWLSTIDALRQELGILATETHTLQSRVEAFQPQRNRLTLAMKAFSLEGAYATLTAIRKQQMDDQTALNALVEALPRLEAVATQQAAAASSAEQHSLHTKEELRVAAPLIQRVRALDLLISEKNKTIAEGEQGYTQLANKLTTYHQAKCIEQEKINATQKNLKTTIGYLTTHEHDEGLVHGLTGIEEQLSALLTKQREITATDIEQAKVVQTLTQANKKLADCRKECAVHTQALVQATQNLRHGKETLNTLLAGKLLREYRTQKETLLREMAFQAKIVELEAHRVKLEAGAPCPLCGATAHPFAHGNVPVPDALERQIATLTTLIRKAEDLEVDIKKYEVAEIAAQKNVTENEKQEALAAHNTQDAEKNRTAVQQKLEKLKTAFTELQRAVLIKLEPLGIKELHDTVLATLGTTLKERLAAWQNQTKHKAEIEKQLAEGASELKRLDAIIETAGAAINEQRTRLDTFKKDFLEHCAQRKNLYADKNPDTEEARLYQAVATAETAEKKTRTTHLEQLHQVNAATTQAASLRQRIDQHAPQRQMLEADFIAALEPLGLAEEQAFLEARVPAEQREALASTAKELDVWQTELNAKQKDREMRLATELAKKTTDKALPELQQLFSAQEEGLKQLRETIASLTHTLRENSAAKKRIADKQAAIEAQKAECRRWENLHELIGSADGKKYRNFAQGLTFETMVGHANRQLQKMTDRYLLIRDETLPLELNVVDTYQAGEIRSTKNLSGGESFLVSLALALGLSHMASKNVRVDSLFLDEGFGTLDEDALETALETLASLHQGGKLIGVISHVSAIKDRISTQIQVTPHTGGRSRISGPGCTRSGQA